jgi:hypothetical protein
MRTIGIALLATCIVSACTPADEKPAPPAPQPSTRPAPATAAGFVNRVWTVSKSTAVQPGTIYVFLSDGTLLITSPHSKPLIGSWKKTESGLTMIEESISYRVDVLELTESSFVIRSHNPGEPVDIWLVPAPSA